MRRRVCQIVVVVLAAAVTAACGASSDTATRLALSALAAKAPPSRAPASPPAVKCTHPTASLRPPAALPAPGAMPAGSFMAKIERRGHLIAGVNAGFLRFGYLNPFNGRIEGFEIALVHEIANAIFGNRPDDVQLEALTVSQRIPFVRNRTVDIVVDAVTITCYGRTRVDFSTVYYDAKQRVLVPANSRARGMQDLGGKRVCASANSTPIDVIKRQRNHPIAVGRPQAIDCLVQLQEGGNVAAISTDDAILLGFTFQDKFTKIVGGSLAPVPYGMAISQQHPGFVRFVNGVLARLRADGTWRAIYRSWVGPLSPTTPTPNPPPAVYER